MLPLRITEFRVESAHILTDRRHANGGTPGVHARRIRDLLEHGATVNYSGLCAIHLR